MTDLERLREFAASGSEQAFRALVERYHSMVYNTCLRGLAGRRDLAEDAAQAVFIVLARKARSIRRARGLSSWLFRTANFTVGHMRRAEARRTRYEQEAAEMAELARERKSDVAWWTGFEPCVNEAVAGLRGRQQEAIVLHFLQGKAQKEVAAAMGCSENAARMCITRGLEKLRTRLTRRGVTVSVAALSAYLLGETAQAAGAGAVASCQAAALAVIAGASGAVSALTAEAAAAVVRRLFWVKAKVVAAALGSAAVIGVGATAVLRTIAPDARVSAVQDGNDWTLPDTVTRVAPQSGFVVPDNPFWKQRSGLPRYQDGHSHFARTVSATWSEVNPAEDVYVWDGLDARVAHATASPGSGFLLEMAIHGLAEQAGMRGRTTAPESVIPAWVVEKGKVSFLSDGTAAAWEPGCGYQGFLGQFLRAVGARYREHPRLVAVMMRGPRPGGGFSMSTDLALVREAERSTGLSPATFETWGLRFVNDWAEAFAGQERKLVLPGAPSTYVYANKRAYRAVSRRIWENAFGRGFGSQMHTLGFWLWYADEAGCGTRLTEQGYLEFDDAFPPVANGAVWMVHNGDYTPQGTAKFGPAGFNRMRWFATNMRVLQMRCNWQRIASEVESLVAQEPGFFRWVELEMGRTASDSPDAWCWLRHADTTRIRGVQKVANFERWLLQRDVEPGGRTVPAARVEIPALPAYAGDRSYEFQARRTDRAHGSSQIFFQAARSFIAGGPHEVLLKVTYLDGPPTTWRMDYTGRRWHARTETVETAGSGAWKTVTFGVPDMCFRGAFAKGMDFRISVYGPHDLTVKLVRLIKMSHGRSR
ncbi:MAG: sigma-70 family RNA polymerase sigma factor [Kiritimatiellae bacterium]|nr:sigma-70 family RNA polymerase sigma factor [Kiritimatiellia bacterium]